MGLRTQTGSPEAVQRRPRGPGDSPAHSLLCWLMRAVFSAWFTAGIIAVLALLTLKALAPPAGRHAPVDEYAQVFRVHLPWLLFSILMAFVAAGYVREWAGAPGRVLTALPVPLLGSLTAAVVGIPLSDSALAVTLHLIEGLLGVALGLALARALAQRWEVNSGTPRERRQWRRSR